MMCWFSGRAFRWGMMGLVLGWGLLAACAGPASRSASRAVDTTGTTPGAGKRDTVPRPPPPRTALVRGEVDTCSGTPAPRRCTIRVGAVTAYGANTPPIASGRRVVRVRATVLDRHTLGTLLAEDRWAMTLVHAGPRMRAPKGGSEGLAWALTGVTELP